MELAYGIHKTVLSGFFSENDFRNVRTGYVGSFNNNPIFSKSEPPSAFTSSIQACQAYRNTFLSISANGNRKALAHDGEDIFPKDLARKAAAIAYVVRPRAGTNEHDINEGTLFLLKLLEAKSDEQSEEVWDVLREIIQKRVGRGNNPISPEDQLLLYELLFDFAAQKLKQHVAMFESNSEVEQGPTGQSHFELSLESSRVNLRVIVPQEDLSASQIVDIQDAVKQLVQVAGLSELKDTKIKIGSFFLEATSVIVAKATFESFKKVLEKRLNPGYEERQDSTDNTDAELSVRKDHLQIEALNRLIAVLEHVDAAVVDAGGFVVVKSSSDDGSKIVSKRLNATERQHLNANPDLAKEPAKLLEFLESSETREGSINSD